MSIIAWAWILLAIAIGFGSCLCAAFLVARARTKGAGKCSFWLGLAVLIFGSGVWTTHFVAMMAQEPDMEMGYALLPTVLSAACAIFGAAPAFALVLAPNPVIFRRVASGAILGAAWRQCILPAWQRCGSTDAWTINLVA
ncbi:MHYT domain-containing protein [Acidocella sp. MX-AZ03]|uniref:MHYT domain-containing protein n=1 Tax=Acidocella sp. MX-AZ03 TaxID=2697363 RepID=UPI003FA44281